MKCDVIAQGIVNAARTLSLQVPLVVRLEGLTDTQTHKLTTTILQHHNNTQTHNNNTTTPQHNNTTTTRKYTKINKQQQKDPPPKPNNQKRKKTKPKKKKTIRYKCGQRERNPRQFRPPNYHGFGPGRRSYQSRGCDQRLNFSSGEEGYIYRIFHH